MTEIACTLTPDAIAAARSGLLPGLADHAIASERIADGYVLTLPASSDNLQRIARVIDAERQCCRWLHFDLVVPPGGAAFVLTLTGPSGAADFLAALFEQ
jgi:hypothetical protein